MARQLWIAAVVTLCLCACGRQAEQRLGITLDGSIPADEASSLAHDLDRVSEINSSVLSQESSARMGLRAVQSSTMTDWLSQRVRLVVGADFDWQHNQINTGTGSVGTPQIFGDSMRLHSDSNVVTLMMNLGSSIYLDGRDARTVYSLRTQMGTLRINSPRVGIIQVGGGLFETLIPGSDVDSEANSYLRLAVLFHEARHSDGNGSTAGFPHAMCNSGDYAGNYACEQNVNGPYAIQASLLKSFYRTCSSCNDQERSGMLLQIADYESRLLPNAVMTDPRPERVQ